MRINNIHTERIPNEINSLAKRVTYLSKLSGFSTCSKLSTENTGERGHLSSYLDIVWPVCLVCCFT